MSKFKYFVINLDRRSDRWEKFISQKEAGKVPFVRFSAVDGTKLDTSGDQIYRVFDVLNSGRLGVMGCALSHISLYIKLLEEPECDHYVILEDDAELVDSFSEKLEHIKGTLPEGYGLCYLGHHALASNFILENIVKMPVLEKSDYMTSRAISLGGTTGYIISKLGAKILLDVINRAGCFEAIDRMQQNCANLFPLYYSTPMLVYADCIEKNPNVDTDIRCENVNSVIFIDELQKRLDKERIYYLSRGKVFETRNKEEAESFCREGRDNYDYMVYIGYDAFSIHMSSIYPSYTLGNVVLIVTKKKEERPIERLKRNGKYDISEIKYVNG